VLFVHNFSLPLFAHTHTHLYIYIYIYIYIIQFHLYYSVNIYSNCLQEKFCNLSLCTLCTLPVQYISLKKRIVSLAHTAFYATFTDGVPRRNKMAKGVRLSTCLHSVSSLKRSRRCTSISIPTKRYLFLRLL